MYGSPAYMHAVHSNITTYSGYGYTGTGLGAPASQVWPVANRAVYTPFVIPEPITAKLMFSYNGAVVNGNIDIGIYDKGGARLVSIGGGVAQAGVDVLQSFDIADTTFGPGLFYLALVLDNNIGAIRGVSAFLTLSRLGGCAIENNAHPLPARATFAPVAGVVRAYFYGLSIRTVI